MPFAQIYMLEGRTEDQKRAVIEAALADGRPFILGEAFSVADAAAQPPGCPRNVDVCMDSPVETGQPDIASPLPIHAEIGIPPPRILPQAMMSGVTP